MKRCELCGKLVKLIETYDNPRSRLDIYAKAVLIMLLFFIPLIASMSIIIHILNLSNSKYSLVAFIFTSIYVIVIIVLNSKSRTNVLEVLYKRKHRAFDE